MAGDRVQTNLRLSAESAATLDIAAAIEGTDKARIVEEALRLREQLMSEEYRGLLRAALAVRQAADPAERLRAIEQLREPLSGTAEGGSTTVSAALARLRSRVAPKQ